MTGAMGDNRLAFVVDDARQAMGRLLQGEEFTIGAWLAYGHALIEARELLKGDAEFGRWLDENSLRQVAGPDGIPRHIEDHERAAAMWAAANPVQFEEARQRGNPRTIRGIHAKWKEIEAERAAEARKQAQPLDQAPPRSSVAASESAAEPEAVLEEAPEVSEERREVAELTTEAMIDEIIGLRADLKEEKARRKEAERARDRFKADLAELMGAGDQGEVNRRLSKKIEYLRSQMFRGDEKFAAEKRRTHALRKELDAMRKPP